MTNRRRRPFSTSPQPVKKINYSKFVCCAQNFCTTLGRWYPRVFWRECNYEVSKKVFFAVCFNFGNPVCPWKGLETMWKLYNILKSNILCRKIRKGFFRNILKYIIVRKVNIQDIREWNVAIFLSENNMTSCILVNTLTHSGSVIDGVLQVFSGSKP